MKPVAEAGTDLPRRQVVSVSALGEMSGLQRKPGDGIDLLQFGRASVQRASEIVWLDNPQRWAIRLLDPAYYPGLLRMSDFSEATGMQRLTGCLVLSGDPYYDGVMAFKQYDHAVLAEVYYLDSVRLGK